MADFDKQVAAKLWAAGTITLDRFFAKVQVHPNSVFLGYADITLDYTKTIPGLVFKFRDLSVKTIKGAPAFGVPEEKMANGEYIPSAYFPKSAELRAVITTFLHATPEVKAAIASLAAPKPAQADASNPFAG